jgi:phage terminase large subunit
MRERYGEDTNAWRTRVTGEFPITDDDTVIPLHLIESAMHRDIEAAEGVTPVWSLDVARMGDDASVLCKRVGRVVIDMRVWRKLDLMQLCGSVVAEYEALPVSEQPDHLYVDSSGLGAGVADRLQELGLPVTGINVSESPSMGTQYLNLRAELWFRLKAWLEGRDCRLPRGEDLLAELSAPKYSFTSSGKIKIEGKSEMKSRGLKSPDMADALCLSLSGDAAIALHGSAGAMRWNKPIRRNLRGIA